MPRNELILSIFVGSPSDVQDERDRLDEIVKEINANWSKLSGVRFELVKWETHARPQIGADPQAIINEQIEDDYDYFIGIFWARAGTPTKRSISGTIEEFERAEKRFNSGEGLKSIMLYFKNAPVHLDEIDLDQMKTLKEFKMSIEGKSFYSSFSDLAEFERLVRTHLTREMQQFVSTQNTALEQSATYYTEREASKPETDEDLGIFDLIETAIEKIQELTALMGTYTDDLKYLTDKTEDNLGVIRDIQKGNRESNARDLRIIIQRTAADMADFNDKIEKTIPAYKDLFREASDALVRRNSMAHEFTPSSETIEEHRAFLVTVKSLRDTLAPMKSSTSNLQYTVESLPRLTKDLNVEKRRLAKNLSSFVREFDVSEKLLEEVESSLDSYIQYALGILKRSDDAT